MAISSNQGMGQYRYESSRNYIVEKVTIGKENSNISPEYLSQGESIVYRDIQIPLNDNNIVSNGVYYLHLELPQHIQYTTTVRIKICGSATSAQNTYIDTNAFQEIRELIIPPAPPVKDENALEQIILYKDPRVNENSDPSSFPSPSPLENYIYANIVYNMPSESPLPLWKEGNIYTDGNSYYIATGPQETDKVEIKEYSVGQLEKKWLTAGSAPSVASFDIVFSPKFNLTSGYSYILLEIDRNGGHQTQIQYIGDDGNSYYGTYMDKNLIKGTLYEVQNLLIGQNSTDFITAPIKSGNSGILNHIAVWSHPELLLAINGEEIKVGQTNFYELDDFNIDFLGVVAKDGSDRFTIDYQYQVK